MAKIFDRVEFRGKVDSFRKVRQRYYYHITYDDGDEEEMRQVELRDAYLLANADKIQTEWDQLQVEKQSDKDVEAEQSSQGETDSSSEGSEYDRHDYEYELKQGKRKRKTSFKPAMKRPKCYKRAQKTNPTICLEPSCHNLVTSLLPVKPLRNWIAHNKASSKQK